MTRSCSSLPSVERSEQLSVDALLALTAAVRSSGGPQSLLFAHIDWSKLQGVPSQPLGAPAPQVARETYTRTARREQRQRQLARRGGIAGLARALAR